MKINNINVEFSHLIKPEYISSPKGSSFLDLVNVAHNYGLYAKSIGKLTVTDLKAMSSPTILHVKSNASLKKFDHYELFLGVENDKAIIYNPSEPIKLVHWYDLAPRWGGTGLIVSATPIDTWTVFAVARRRFIMYAAIAVGVVLVVRLGRQRWLPAIAEGRRNFFGWSVVQCGGLVVFAVLGGMIYHFACDEGLLANAKAVGAIQEGHLGNFIPKVSKSKVSRLLKTDTVFIDARLFPDFQAGHMEGAISVPVNATDDDRKKATADIPKDARIVAYCQSAGCKYAEIVTIKLLADGYSDVAIFKGGWGEWTEKNEK